MKHILAALVAIGLALGLVAVEAAEIKIGFIDIQRLQRESAPAERASKQLEKEFAPRLQELQRRENQIKTL
ncbi:MAG: OmpH family outer membrane protein, partial [Betaproteobacteria bacterium]|nr:OmpH family outer membrane protein [Betaproteobacteria bacterium]